MRIAYLFHDHLPTASTNGEQLVNSLAMLARQGMEIDLIVPSPPGKTRPLAERRAAITAFYGLPGDTFDRGLNLVELALPDWIGGNARRATVACRASLRLRDAGYDLVYVRDLFPLATAVAMARTPVVFETYRTDVNTRRAYGPWRAFCYRRGKIVGVLTHSRLAARRFLEAGFRSEEVLVAHNGFSPGVMGPPLTTGEARARLGLPADRTFVVYTGQVNPSKGIEAVVEIARRLPAITFLVVGAVPGSPGETWAHRIIADAGVGNVQLVPRVPPTQVPLYLYAADCLVIPPTAKPLEDFGRTVLPIKTYLYLAAGRPIIAGDLPDVGEVLVDRHNALLVPPDDPEAAAAAVTEALGDPRLREHLAATARQDAQQYTWESRAVRIAAFLRERLAAFNRRRGGRAAP